MCGRLLWKSPQWRCSSRGTGLDGSLCCPSGWTRQDFSTQGASGRLRQLRRAMPWLPHPPAYMATWPAVSPGHSQALVGCLFIASEAGGSLRARGEEIKGRGGTRYHLLMLLGCISFQCCRTEAGLAGSW